MNDNTYRKANASELGVNEADLARVELYDTLAQLRDRLNYAQRIDNAVDDAKLRLAETRRSKPLAFAAGCVGVATLAGLAAWGIARRVSRNFR